jgi:hypothetical protein
MPVGGVLAGYDSRIWPRPGCLLAEDSSRRDGVFFIHDVIGAFLKRNHTGQSLDDLPVLSGWEKGGAEN